jgi:hypothetical protein
MPRLWQFEEHTLHCTSPTRRLWPHLVGCIHGSPRTQKLPHHLQVPLNSCHVQGGVAILQQQQQMAISCQGAVLKGGSSSSGRSDSMYGPQAHVHQPRNGCPNGVASHPGCL